MSIVPKITRLTKLPELLKHKQEAEERSKKDREQSKKQKREQPSFNMEDEASINSSKMLELKVDKPTSKPQNEKKAEAKGKGGRVDLQV
ncbi:MAG: hypothetical protein FH748_00730 [Balneolaceae bacterium]|nr:hypothetical protein [Balneolaceae bacterium]